MKPCGYCGVGTKVERFGVWVCPAHDDLPELEWARQWLEQRACRHFDGHRKYWSNDDAHAVKVLVRATG